MRGVNTAERVSASDASDNFVFQRSLLAYHEAAGMVSGDVLEIGTGSGYGISVISPAAGTFLTVDKHAPPVAIDHFPNARFRQMRVPPLGGIPDESFDYVVMFQVIEHIKNDTAMLAEIHRVLRKGGRFIVTTPNRLMSLTRNPWHVREYTPEEFTRLLQGTFDRVEARGIFGNDNVMEYYAQNRESVRRVARFDIFRFQKWLPNFLLRIPYDILNRINRRKLLKQNTELTERIRMDDYFFASVSDTCFDLFYVAEK